MQKTRASTPCYDPSIEEFENLYGQWASADYGLIVITDRRPLCVHPAHTLNLALHKLVDNWNCEVWSKAGDVICHTDALEGVHFEK